MLNTGIFPDKLKQSKVTPIFEANDKELLFSYRPISVLSSMSKLYEYAISDQLTRLTYFMDQGKIPLNIYINLSKAFDTLNF